MPVQPVLSFAHQLAKTALGPGDSAVDATVGNGHDTLVLARTVGTGGRVYGFDVQEEALAQTRDRLAEASLKDVATLFLAGHETMGHHLPVEVHGQVGAVMFNLGYLPGSASPVTTQPETTLSALNSALELLRPGGVITIVLYTGHEGGQEEAAAVDVWASELPQGCADALSYRFVNQGNDPPRLVAVEKQGTSEGS